MSIKDLTKQGLLLVVMTLMLAACSDSKNDEPDPVDSQKKAILTQYVNGVVVPTYRSLADNAIELSDLCSELKESPSQALLQEACNKWIEARKYWELSEAFLYGAAADYYIDPHIDSWPLQKNQLDNILANSTLIAELNEDGAGADGFATLGYGLLGFHAVEYVLFRDGHARNIGDISENELIYNAAVAEDLAWQTVRLEAAWAGIDNVTSAKRKILEENELEPSLNYGEQMISAGLAGNSAVGNTKITDPVNSGNVLDVESWYSWNSIADFTDNLRSVRNAYYGSLDGSVNSSSLAAYLHKNNPTVDTELRSAIDNAIKTVAAMPAPFRNHLTKAETQAAVDACNKCMEALDAAIEVLQ